MVSDGADAVPVGGQECPECNCDGDDEDADEDADGDDEDVADEDEDEDNDDDSDDDEDVEEEEEEDEKILSKKSNLLDDSLSQSEVNLDQGDEMQEELSKVDSEEVTDVD